MHSIRTRIMALTLAAILVSVLSIGLVSLVSIQREGDRSSMQTMRLLCDNCRHSIDEYLTSIERSVALVSRYAGEGLSSVELVEGGVIGLDGRLGGQAASSRDEEQQDRLDEYLAAYLKNVEEVFLSVANHTDGVIAFYYRFNPELSRQSRGFVYTRLDDAVFSAMLPTKIEDYRPDDVSHVGWYYTALERGRPSWIEPYYNENMGINMVSYVTPLYKAGTFIGVIGMDISYETLVSQIKDIRIYQTGSAYLVEKDGTIVYHPTLESGTRLAEYQPKLAGELEQLTREKSSSSRIVYSMDGEAKLMFFTTLSNDLKLIVAAPVREINGNTMRLGNVIVFTSLAILFVFATIAIAVVNRLTGPLKRLTEASKHLAEGNYDVQLDYAGDDEVGTLTRVFQQLVKHLRIYISDLNSKAYQDAMTGVKNKGAYDISAHKLDDAIHMAAPGEPPEFALVMLDCNDLKKINDTYGHEKGDDYLRGACRLICRVFAHCPVFRIGGDEFAVILQEEAYAEREELLRRFDEQIGQANAAAEKEWERVNIARGVALYDPETDRTSADVLNRADKLMYEDKKRAKAAPR